MASARDEHDTVPPPPGEEDAYSAATKVGAMPADLMARLRAEGLLPDEDETEPRPAASRPAAGVAPHATPSASPQRSPFDDVPELSSDPPPGEDAYPIAVAPRGPSAPEAERAPMQDVRRAGVATSSAPAPLETPVAFASPPSPDPAGVQEAAPLSGRSVEAVRAFGGRSKRLQSTLVLVAVLVALVAFAFVMALLSQRR